jgi:hypothetical protein
MNRAALIVIAKDPRPGIAKTRLCPPCSPAQAAGLAAAALSDTLDVVARTPAARKVLVLDGDRSRWERPGLEVIAQRGTEFSQRLGFAFVDVAGPALLIGMDTPQLTPALLSEGLSALNRFDAVLGPAWDGGYWSVGLREPHEQAFRGVPMSTAVTLRHQHERFTALGLKTYEQRRVRDVDTIADARLVAREAPWSRFAQAVGALR